MRALKDFLWFVLFCLGMVLVFSALSGCRTLPLLHPTSPDGRPTPERFFAPPLDTTRRPLDLSPHRWQNYPKRKI